MPRLCLVARRLEEFPETLLSWGFKIPDTLLVITLVVFVPDSVCEWDPACLVFWRMAYFIEVFWASFRFAKLPKVCNGT